MGLTAPQIEEHIQRWEGKLRASYRSYRDKWPSRLFHHAPIENAARIISSGRLLSRNDVAKLNVRDVASQEVVNSNSAAHKFARLYFRPRTPTQYYVEGVRKSEDCYRGELTVHAPVLVVFVFSAKAVLGLGATAFSTGNMQSPYSSYGSDAEHFGEIDFERVYHEGGTGGDHAITHSRCAEVLAPSPLPLAGNLQFILCRSQAERRSLLHAIGSLADKWSEFIRVSDDIQVFHKEYAYLEEVTLTPSGVVFRIHPRVRDAAILVQVEAVKSSNGKAVASFGPALLDAVPGGGKTRWIAESDTALAAGNYTVTVWLEGHVAYRAELSIGPKPF